MTADRIRAAVLYAGAAALLVGGAFWWAGAAPRQPVDPSIAQWTAIAERLLPQPLNAEAGDTLELGAGIDREISAKVADGPHHVAVVCVGGRNSLVRVTLGQVNDSGRGLDCAGDPEPLAFDVGVAGGLRMNLSVAGTSPVVFRYTVTKGTD